MPNANKDPYAPPPRYRDNSGALVRIVIIAALLGVAVWGYTYFEDQQELEARALENAQEQQMAQAQPGYGSAPGMPTQQSEPALGAAPGQQPAPAQEPAQQPASPGAEPSAGSPSTAPPPAPTPQ
jgi:type II secretory pathway pseudopilin PulG